MAYILYCHDRFGNRIVRGHPLHQQYTPLHHRLSVKTLRTIRVQGRSWIERDEKGAWKGVRVVWNREGRVEDYFRHN